MSKTFSEKQPVPQTQSPSLAETTDFEGPSMAPPTFQLKADPLQRKMPGGEEEEGVAAAPTVSGETASPTVTTGDTEETTETEEEKSVTLSRGVLQFITEADFNGGGTDCRKPHFPQNIYIYQKLTDDEKSDDETKKYTGSRFTGPDDIGRFKSSATGDFKRLALQDRHSTATYSQTLATDQQLGTEGGTSGLTIGFGIDIGNKWGTSDTATVKKYFTDGDVAEADATTLSEAAGVKGLEAAKKTANARAGINLTDEQVYKVLKAAIPDYDNNGYTRGDNTYHPAIEEAIMYAGYWGESTLRTTIKNGAKDKTGTEQFEGARDAVKTKLDAMSATNWKRNGYNSVYMYLAQLADMSAGGYEINMTDAVLSKADLVKDDDDTFRFVEDVTERKNDYGAGKDLRDQMDGNGVGYLKDPVGEGTTAINNTEDVTFIQQLLYNGDFDIEVNGTYDTKTKDAIQKFMQDNFNKVYDTVDPDGRTFRHMKKLMYKTRTEVEAEATTPATTTTE